MTIVATEGSIESALDKILEPPAEPEMEPEKEAEPEEEVEQEEPESEPEGEPEGEPEEEAEPEGEPDGGGEDDEPDAERDDDKDTTGTLFSVKIDGKETQVSLDDLKRGYSGQQYVQQGMREAAAARKEAEGVYTQLMQERQRIGQMLQTIQQGGINPPPAEPDKALFQQDPIGYMEAKIAYDEQKATYDDKLNQMQGIASQQGQADKLAMQAYMQGELKSLQALEPEFADEKAAPVLRDKLIKTGQEVYGYQPEEIAGITDHRALRVLRDAQRYHDIVAGKEKAKAKVKSHMAKKGAKKTVTTGEAKRRKQRAKLKSTGSIDDALGLLMQ